MTRLLLSPSILTADFGRLREEIASVAPLVDWFHLDVMDGHYVSNITFGPTVVASIREACDTPLHVHLMISEPARYAQAFADAGATRMSFHPEVVETAAQVIDEINGHGVGAGIAVHPDVPMAVVEPHLDRLEVILVMTVRPGFGGQRFMAEVVPKIAAARLLVTDARAAVDVEVDGGVNLQTVGEVVKAGASIIVAGSAIYDGVDAPAAAMRLRNKLDQLAGTASTGAT